MGSTLKRPREREGHDIQQCKIEKRKKYHKTIPEASNVRIYGYFDGISDGWHKQDILLSLDC